MIKDEIYIKSFIKSKPFADLSVNLQKTAKSDIKMFLDFLHNYEEVNLKNIRRHHVEFILTELLLAKYAAEPEEFRELIPVFIAFFNHLKEDGIIKNADGIIKEIMECEEIMVENAADPECYEMGKTMAMQANKEKIDFSDREAVSNWITKFNARPNEERGQLFDRFTPLSAKSEMNPKIGRNEPCLCGSGKKYKKRCGK